MFQDMLSCKLVRAGLIGCLLLIAASLLYRRHVVGAIRRDEARTQQFLREFEAKIAAVEKIDTDNAKLGVRCNKNSFILKISDSDK